MVAISQRELWFSKATDEDEDKKVSLVETDLRWCEV